MSKKNTTKVKVEKVISPTKANVTLKGEDKKEDKIKESKNLIVRKGYFIEFMGIEDDNALPKGSKVLATHIQLKEKIRIVKNDSCKGSSDDLEMKRDGYTVRISKGEPTLGDSKKAVKIFSVDFITSQRIKNIDEKIIIS